MANVKISNLPNLVDVSGQFLVPIVDTDNTVTKKISISNLKKLNLVELNVDSTNLTGNTTVFEGPILAHTQDNRLCFLEDGGVSTGQNAQWENILLSTDRAFVANIELANATGVVLNNNTIGHVGGVMKIGNNTDVAEELPSIPKVSMLKPTRHEFNAATVGSGDYRKFDEDFSFSYTLGDTSGDSKKFMAEISLNLEASNGTINIGNLELVLEAKLTKDIGTLGLAGDGTSLNVSSSLINFSKQVVQTGTLPTLENDDITGPPVQGFPPSATFPYFPYGYSDGYRSGILLLDAPSSEITSSATNISFKCFFEHKQLAETATGLSYDLNFYIKGDDAHPTDYLAGKITYTNSSLVFTEL